MSRAHEIALAGTISASTGGGGGGTGYAAAVLGHTPDLYWKFQETSGTTATDSSGNSRDGTYGANCTLNQAGLLTEAGDKSVSMDGSSTVGVLSTYNGVYQNGQRKLIVGWATLTDAAAYRPLFGDAGGNLGLFVLPGTTDVDFRPFDGAASAKWTGSWADGMWALDFDEPNNTTELWINGVSQGSKSLSTNWVAASNFLAGRDTTLGWKGKQSHIAVFTGNTTPGTVVADLYAAGTI